VALFFCYVIRKPAVTLPATWNVWQSRMLILNSNLTSFIVWFKAQ
jgi:hypothetical protein